jgi:hypothetical protein
MGFFAFTTIGGGCIGPPAVVGSAQGESCVRNMDCDDGLVCECRSCTNAADATEPPVCDVSPNVECGEAPSNCYASCGEEVITGLAECVNGAETCVANGGVLYSDCPDDTCWGDAAPGEVCIDGAFECLWGESNNGDCYTFDCPDNEAELCVLNCESVETFAQVCVASAWRCESGFPLRQCGGCVGTPPQCFDNCENQMVLFTALCLENEWSCDGVLVDAGVLSSECEVDGGAMDGGSGDAGLKMDGGDEGDAGSFASDGGILSDGGQLPDAGLEDAGGSLDGGTVEDAGNPDDSGVVEDGGHTAEDGGAAAVDAGSMDEDGGFQTQDAGNLDAGESSDSGEPNDAGSGGEVPEDGGETDAGVGDAGDGDAGDGDAGNGDAGNLDAG